MIDQVCVIIPARNEAEMIGGCLHAVAAAASEVEAVVTIVVVLDSCTDNSRDVITEVSAAVGIEPRVITARVRSAGGARRVGVADAIRRAGIPAQQLWIASTDADSVVPRDWLVRHLAHAMAGADLVAGTVQVADWTSWPDQVRVNFEERYARHLELSGHGHIHGANLGIRADLYQRLGGFDCAAINEDAELIRRARRDGVAVTWALDMAVRTSSRAVGRAPLGFADYLHRLDDATAGAPDG